MLDSEDNLTLDLFAQVGDFMSKIIGYKELTEEKISAVNINKKIEIEILKRIEALHIESNCDKRWLSIAKTHIQEGFMALNRSIIMPDEI